VRVQQRRQWILKELEQQETVSVAELADALGVSDNTIRNDLDALAEEGLIVRTHGGATLPGFMLPSQLRPKASRPSSRGHYIVDCAASWVEEGDSLILGDSPMCVMLAERLSQLRRLRVITTSIPVAYTLLQEPTNTVVLAGGEVDREALATQGSMAETAIRNFRANKAFFSCTGVSGQNGLTDRSTESAAIKRKMKEAAESVFVLVESDRMGKIDLFPIGDLSEARRIFTDAGLSHEQAQLLAEEGEGQVTLCWEGGHQTHRRRTSDRQFMRVGFANLSDGIWFSRAVRQSVEQAAEQMSDMELLVTDNQNKMEMAVRNAEALLKEGIDLLIEYDGSGLATRPVRRLTRLAEVPVIAIDIPMVAAIHFGCDHDAAGVTAGQELARWVQAHWGGQLDVLLLVTNMGGGTMQADNGVRLERWTGEGYLSGLTPSTRLNAALEALQLQLRIPEVRKLELAGDWTTSEEAVARVQADLNGVLASISADQRVGAVCLVPEDALGFAQATRNAGRCDQFAVVSFGSDSPAILKELARPDTCLIGVVDLHPELYGPGLLRTARDLLRGKAVPPAVFVEHTYLSQEAVLAEQTVSETT